MIAREIKREKLRTKYQQKRLDLKKVIHSVNSTDEEKWQAVIAFQKLPRNASPVRRQRRCNITGRPHGVYRKFGLSRNMLRIHAMKGDIPGLVKASW